MGEWRSSPLLQVFASFATLEVLATVMAWGAAGVLGTEVVRGVVRRSLLGLVSSFILGFVLLQKRAYFPQCRFRSSERVQVFANYC